MRRVLIALGGLGIAFGLWLFADLLFIAKDLRSGTQALDSLAPTQFDRPGGVAAVTGRARSQLVGADWRARRSIPLRVVSLVPGLAPQVATLRDVSDRAAEVGRVVDDAARPLQAEVDKGMGGAQRRMAVVETMAQSFDSAAHRIAGIEPFPKRRFAHPLMAVVRNEVAEDMDEARREVDRRAPQIKAIRDLFAGPSRYAVLAGNNAEMRASAMVLSVGRADINRGDIRLSKFVGSQSIFVRDGPEIPKELEELYGWMSIGREWRAGTASPDFPTVGAMYADMAARKRRLGNVQGVIFIDVVTLQRMLFVIGPVEVGGKTYTVENVGDEIMYRNYLQFGENDLEVQNQRRDLQSAIGRAVFSAFTELSLPIGKLFHVLEDLVHSRHLMVWSAAEPLQRLWSDLGADGALRSDGFMVVFDNVSANKLDYHLDPTVRLKTISRKNGVRRVRVTLTVENSKREPTAPYIEGYRYGKTHDIPPGGHRFYVKYYLPDQAFDVSSANPGFNQLGRDGPMHVATYFWTIQPESTETRTIEFSVPDDFDPVLIPAGRYRAIRYYIGDSKDPIYDRRQTELKL